MENPMAIAAPSSIMELEGLYYAYHPKPDEYDPYEWFSIVKEYHILRGRDNVETFAAIEFEPTIDPYPLENKIKTWGVEAVWE